MIDTFVVSRLAVVVGLWTLAGCAAGAPNLAGHFGTKAFYHRTYPMTVAYGDATRGRFLGSDWTLDNYQVTEGRPLKPKRGPGYQTVVRLDANGDGIAESRATLPLQDIKLTHKRTAGVIWLRTIPISDDLAEKEMHVLLARYLDAVSDSGHVVVQLTDRRLELDAAHRYATRVVSRTPAQLEGFDALAATFEVANLSDVNVGAGRWQRTRVVLARTPFRAHLGGHGWPVLIVAGYSNLAEDFDRNLSEFQTFLGLVGFRSDEERLVELDQEKQCSPPHRDIPNHIIVKIASDGELSLAPLDGKSFTRVEMCWRRAVKGFAISRDAPARTLDIDLQALPTPSNEAPASYRELQPEPPGGDVTQTL